MKLSERERQQDKYMKLKKRIRNKSMPEGKGYKHVERKLQRGNKKEPTNN